MEEYELQMKLIVDQMFNVAIPAENMRERLYNRKLMLTEIKAYSDELISKIPNLTCGNISYLTILYTIEIKRFIREYQFS
jgi:hypothetical protein